MEYNRFEHYQSPVKIKVRVNSDNASKGIIQIWVSREYMEGVELRHLDPQPNKVEVNADKFTYFFDASTNGGPFGVILHLEPNQFGKLLGKVGLPEGPELEFHQCFYP